MRVAREQTRQALAGVATRPHGQQSSPSRRCVSKAEINAIAQSKELALHDCYPYQSDMGRVFFAGIGKMMRKLFLPILMCLSSAPAEAQIAQFEHVVLIIQENRTPDNLFYALCATEPCSTTPDSTEYDIQTANWLSQGGPIQPLPVPLASKYDLAHRHVDFVRQCDYNASTQSCSMDGAEAVGCNPAFHCPQAPQFRFVTNFDGVLTPYLSLAEQYGWANYMFQTNQGPSFPAHQFLFGETSAPSAEDDQTGIFMAEDLNGARSASGCVAPLGTKLQLINAMGVEKRHHTIYPCVEHQTLADLLDGQSVSWRYYAPSAGDHWMAPDAIQHICQPVNQQCTGTEWNEDVDFNPVDVLSDIGNCALSGASWVVPSASYSDHAGSNSGLGPSWVAQIVNAIGASSCTNPDGTSYWNSTAIIVVWDDWGGWYDHEPPTILPYPEGGYQYGFRVPMLFISAYTQPGLISNTRLDFGSIGRFIEYNFGIPMGALTFADERSADALGEFYDLTQAPRPFTTVPGAKPPGVFRHQKLQPPDDD
jgi:phospholipase C